MVNNTVSAQDVSDVNAVKNRAGALMLFQVQLVNQLCLKYFQREI